MVHQPAERPTLSNLLPFQTWFADRDWQRGITLGLLALGLAPSMLLHLYLHSTSIVLVAWGFSIYFGLLWAGVLWALARPGRVPAGLAVAVVLESLLVGVPLAIFLEAHFVHSTSLPTMVFAVGLPEEVAKALPVLVFVYRSHHRTAWSPKLYMYLGVLSGLTFGCVEAVEYVSEILRLSYFVRPSQLMSYVVWRLLTDSLFHAVTAGISCYLIGLAAHLPQWRFRLIGFGLGLTALLHGINDRYAASWAAVVVTGGLLLVFVGYARDGGRIEALLGVRSEDHVRRFAGGRGRVGVTVVLSVAASLVLIGAILGIQSKQPVVQDRQPVTGTSGYTGTSGSTGTSGPADRVHPAG